MDKTTLDTIVLIVARVLEGMFLFGGAMVVVVIVLTVTDIVRDALTPDSQPTDEIDAIRRAA